MKTKGEIPENGYEHERIVMPKTNGIIDVNIGDYIYYATPRQLRQKYPRSEKAQQTVLATRQAIKDIMDRKDNRKIMLAGGCSVHLIPEEKSQYKVIAKLNDDPLLSKYFLFLTRSCMEKPRTGPDSWQGKGIDPDFQFKQHERNLGKGREISRELFLYANELGLPIATEYLDRETPQYTGGLVSLAWIGARSMRDNEMQKMGSILSMPTFYKNTLNGSLDLAISGILAAREKQIVRGIDEDGVACDVRGRGNKYCGLILRGSDSRPNYYEEDVQKAMRKMEKAGLVPQIIVDCSHGNSKKNHEKQQNVFYNVSDQMKTNPAIIGAMLEVYGVGGQQETIPLKPEGGLDIEKLEERKSLTDPCMSLDMFMGLIENAASKF